MLTDPRAVLAAIQARADAVDPDDHRARMYDPLCMCGSLWPCETLALADAARVQGAALGAVLDLADREGGPLPDPLIPCVRVDDIRAVIAEHLGGAT